MLHLVDAVQVVRVRLSGERDQAAWHQQHGCCWLRSDACSAHRQLSRACVCTTPARRHTSCNACCEQLFMSARHATSSSRTIKHTCMWVHEQLVCRCAYSLTSIAQRMHFIHRMNRHMTLNDVSSSKSALEVPTVRRTHPRSSSCRSAARKARPGTGCRRPGGSGGRPAWALFLSKHLGILL